MMVPNGPIMGSSLGLFLILCISMNGDVVSGQTVRILTVDFSEDLSALYLQTCFNSFGQASGEILVATFPDILNQPEINYTVTAPTVSDLCQTHLIPVTISSNQIGSELSVTIEASAITNPPFAVDETANVSVINIPGPTLFFSSNMYEVTEGDVNGNTKAMLTVCQTPSTFSSSASVAILGLNAEVALDYSEVTSLTTLQPTEECTTLQIDIISDTVAEENEMLFIHLEPESSSRVSAASGASIVTIIDDDNLITTPVNIAPVLSGCPVGTVNSFTTTPSCNDAEDGARTVTCNPPAGNNFQLGVTTFVTCSCTDNARATRDCFFNVLAPVLNMEPTLFGCPVGTVNSFTATPNCNDAEDGDLDVTCNPPTEYNFQAGTTTPVSCFCRDSGTATDVCTFSVVVATILATELETRLMDIINTISGENTTTEEVVMASEAIAELSDNEDFLEENPQRIELVISSLESVVRAGEASINVTDPAVRTINNLMNLDLDILEDGMIEGGRAVAALEGQITNFHTSDGNFSTVLDNVGVTAVKIDAGSVGSSLAYANVFPKNEIPLYDGALQEGNTRLFSDGDAIPLNRTASSISVPTTVLELLGEAGVELTAVPVTFIIYGNDVLFRPSMPTEVEEYIKEEDNSTVTERAASQIISAIIRTENTSIVKLPPGSPVITTFVSNLTITVNETVEALDCVVWSYNENTGEGFWTKDGCERMPHDNRGLTMCSCDRLGSFAVLIRVRKGRVEAQVALYYITLIGSIISGLALIGCLVIFVSLKSFRSKQPTHIHINLCLSLLGFYIAFLLSPLAVGKEIRCTVASVFIHFFSLATLAWMSAEAMNMYYLFLKAARSTVRHFIPIACLLAYGLPAVCALLVVFLDNSTDFQSASYCFIHPGYALYFGFLTEVGAMFVFNFIIFIWLICKILCRPLMVSKTAENAKRNEIIKRVRHAILFWFILGLSWIFGFFAAVDTTTLIFDYLYCFFISIQGILMFILLCVANPAFRGIFKKKDFMRTKVTTQTTTKNLTSSQLVSSSQYEIPMDSIDNPSTFATE
ncbi:adhesion G-protein coupled receptor G4-like [Apostichopus japonicus]|uniref:adhesion G-protein coupled receptor G4-like n=1 Tax=Stichopus japonicus TaxID=307972 RepID=UPI003AB234A8